MPVSLILIEWVIKKDRERQWERVESLTYMTILYNLCCIAYSIPRYMPIDSDIESRCKEIIKTGISNPRNEVSNAISDLAKTTKESIQRWEQDTDNLINQQKYDEYDQRNRWLCNQLIECEDDIGWFIRDIRVTLIPRVLQLSDNQEINSGLLDFENMTRDAEFLMRWQRTSENVVLDHEIFVRLLEETAKLYSLIQKMTPMSEDILANNILTIN